MTFEKIGGTINCPAIFFYYGVLMGRTSRTMKRRRQRKLPVTEKKEVKPPVVKEPAKKKWVPCEDNNHEWNAQKLHCNICGAAGYVRRVITGYGEVVPKAILWKCSTCGGATNKMNSPCPNCK